MNEIIDTFLKKRKNIIDQKIKKTDLEHKTYCLNRDLNYRNICVILSNLYLLKCMLLRNELKDCNTIILKILEKLKILISNITAQYYTIYYSPQRNITDLRNLKSVSTYPNSVKLNFKDIISGKYIFFDENRDYFSIDNNENIHINVNKNTILELSKNYTLLNKDYLVIEYCDIFYKRLESGELKIYKYKGIDINLLYELKDRLEKEISIKNILKAINITNMIYESK